MFSNRQHVVELIKKTGKKVTKKEVDELMEFATDESRYSVKFPPGYWIGHMLRLSLDVADLFIDSNWDIYYFNKKYALITCDNPVVLVPPKEYDYLRGYGLATPGTLKVVSLTSNIGLVIKELTNEPEIIYKDTDNKDIYRWVNKISADNSDRFIYGPEKDKLTKLVKDTKIDTYLKARRIGVTKKTIP